MSTPSFEGGLPRKTAITILLTTALVVSWHLAANLRRPAPKSIAVNLPPPVPRVKPKYLDVPPGSLKAFFDSLDRKRVTRVLHYGDSPTTADSITSDIRSLLQKRFGDAGHGFLLIAKPWAWYGHAGVKLDAKGWQIDAASQSRAPDGIHGLGGVSFRGQAGAVSTVRLPAGHTNAIVYYLAQPGGGTFVVHTGDQTLAEINTEAGEKELGFAAVALPDGTETLETRVTQGSVRLFGYRFDKPGPGIQYSSIGVNGAQVQMVVRYFELNTWTEALRHEDPDLVVLNYGTNESIYPAYIEKQYPGELRTVIARLRAALPNASILVMSPMDRGIADQSGAIVTPEALVRLIEVQKLVAAETGCAFFNTFEAMGGTGTMGRWYKAQPRLVSADFMHPLPQGAAMVGKLFESALMEAR